MAGYFVGGAAALVFVTALAAANYFITRKLLRKGGEQLAVISILRQTLNIAYLVAIYFLAEFLPWPVEGMLIGGALGVTVPSFVFAARLARETGAKGQERQEQNENRKEE